MDDQWFRVDATHHGSGRPAKFIVSMQYFLGREAAEARAHDLRQPTKIFLPGRGPQTPMYDPLIVEVTAEEVQTAKADAEARHAEFVDTPCPECGRPMGDLLFTAQYYNEAGKRARRYIRICQWDKTHRVDPLGPGNETNFLAGRYVRHRT